VADECSMIKGISYNGNETGKPK